MKKTLKYLIAICLAGCMAFSLAACGKGTQQAVSSGTAETKTATAPKELTEDDQKVIADGLELWGKNTLFVDSTVWEENKDTIQTNLKNVITTSEGLEDITSNQDQFYKDSDVTVTDVQAQISNMDLQPLDQYRHGTLDCKLTFQGTRNDQEFTRIITMSLSIYYSDVVSVDQISSIEWTNPDK